MVHINGRELKQVTLVNGDIGVSLHQGSTYAAVRISKPLEELSEDMQLSILAQLTRALVYQLS